MFSDLSFVGVLIVGFGLKAYNIMLVPIYYDVPFCHNMFHGMGVASLVYGAFSMLRFSKIKIFCFSTL